MDFLKRTYLSIGSNLGNKLENLQKTVDMLNEKAGKITAVSEIYQTPAWGFESDDFFNACLELHTALTPLELLKILLDTEVKLGRVRGESKGYQARSIDIDIIYYGDEIINSEELIIPHPYLQNRKFVLQPLNDIAADAIHPLLKKTTTELLQMCEDDSAIEITNLKLK